LRRTLIALPFVVATALVFAGCTEAPAPEPTETTPVAVDICTTDSGDASSAVNVSGDFGTPPTIEFDAPLEVETTQRDVVIEGETVAQGTQVEAAYALYNGTSGELIESLGWGDEEIVTQFRPDLGTLQEGFARTLACLGAGSRAVGVMPMAESFGPLAEDFGLAADDVIVFVVDVFADLAPSEWTTDVPTVDESGAVPVITLPGTPAKTGLESTLLVEGDGAVVSSADVVSVDYVGVAWSTGEVFDESFTTQPYTLEVTGFVPGFTNALIGQKVGSRVLVTIPPSLGYGEAGASDHELAGETLVFVVDIVELNPAD
jgi:hypothetical protein